MLRINAISSRDGAVVRALVSHQCDSGSIPGLGVTCGLSLLLVLVLAPRGFSLDSPVFPSPQKPIFPNSNSIFLLSPYCKAHLIISSWNYALYKFYKFSIFKKLIMNLEILPYPIQTCLVKLIQQRQTTVVKLLLHHLVRRLSTSLRGQGKCGQDLAASAFSKQNGFLLYSEL